MTATNTLNASVLRALRSMATLEGPRSGYSVDGYEIRTHPDLVGRLRDLIVYVPDARFEYVFGTPTLQTATGEIFATAGGTFSLCLRLEGVSDWGRHYEEFGFPWRQGSAWSLGRNHTREDEERLAELVRLAYASVHRPASQDANDGACR